MAAIGFYHLTRGTVAAALPKLLGRTLAAGERAVVRCADAQRLAAIDRALWQDADWLPHGTTHPALQPIWLTTADDRANGGRYLFVLDGAEAGMDGYERVFDLFDGTDEAAVAAARQRWARAKAAGYRLAYWKQDDQGRWLQPDQ